MRQSPANTLDPRAGSFAVARLLVAAVLAAMLLASGPVDGTALRGALFYALLVPIVALESICVRRQVASSVIGRSAMVATFVVAALFQIEFHESLGGSLLLGFVLVEAGMRSSRWMALAVATCSIVLAVAFPSYDAAGRAQPIASIVIGVLALTVAGIAARARFDAVTRRDLELLRAEQRLERLADRLPSAAFFCDDHGRLLYTSARFDEFVGAMVDPASDDPFWGLVHSDDVAIARAAMEDVASGSVSTRLRVRSNDGGSCLVQVRMVRESAPLDHWIGVIEDLSVEESVRAAEAELAAVVRSTSDHVVTWDGDGRVQYANAAATQVFRLPRNLTEVRAADLFDDGGAMVVEGPVGHILQTEGSWSGELAMRSTDGRTFPVLQTLVAHHDPHGRILRVSMIGRDVSGFRAREEQLLRMVRHDPLTGLGNRVGMFDAIEQLRADDRPFALLYLDLDDFKAVNDEHGHRVGDEVLIAVGRRIDRAIRPDDYAARIGGDEFVVVSADVDQQVVADRMIDRLLRSLHTEPVGLDGGGALEVRASVGSALSSEVEIPALLDRADAAMYEHKREHA